MSQSKAKSLTTKSNLQTRQITPRDDLASIATQCNAKEWGDDSELLSYTESSLKTYLKNTDNILVGVLDEATIAGVAIGYVLLHHQSSHPQGIR